MAIAPLTPPPPRGTEIAQGDKTPTNIQWYGWFGKLQKIINDLIASGGGGGGVTTVDLNDISTVPIYTTAPVAPTAGAVAETIQLKTQAANTVLAGPTTGAATQPAFRALVAADIPFSAGLPTLFEANYEQTLHLAIANSSSGLFDTGTITATGQGGGGLTIGTPVGTGTTIDALGWLGNKATSTAVNIQAGFLNAQIQYSIFQSGSGNSYIGNYQAGAVIQYVNVPPATGRVFFGLSKENVSPIVTTAEPSVGTNLVGFSKDSTDTNLQMLVSNGTGPGTKTNTGIAFSSLVGVTLGYKIISSKTSVTLTLYNLDTQTILYIGSASANLPAVNIGLNFAALANNGTSVVSVSEVRAHKFYWALPTI